MPVEKCRGCGALKMKKNPCGICGRPSEETLRSLAKMHEGNMSLSKREESPREENENGKGTTGKE